MAEISRAANLSREYTNHSCRATTVHLLDEAKFPSRHIMSVTGHKSETSLKTYSGKTSENIKKDMSKAISEKTLEITEKTDSISTTTRAPNVLRPTALSSNIDFLSLSQSNIVIENDFDTTFGSLFELQALSSSQTETLLNDLPDNDGMDDFIKTLNIPELAEAQTSINVPTLRSMFSAPTMYNCQNITINYNIFSRK